MIVRLNKVRMRYGNLFTAREPKVKGGIVTRPRFDITIMIEKGSENANTILQAFRDLAVEAWKDQGPAKMKMANAAGRVQLRDGDDRVAVNPEFANHWVLTATAQANKPPQIRDLDGKTVLHEGADRPYRGCLVNVIVSPYYHRDTDRLNCSFLAAQYAGPGEPFGEVGYRVMDSDFVDLSQAMPDVAPSAGSPWD